MDSVLPTLALLALLSAAEGGLVLFVVGRESLNVTFRTLVLAFASLNIVLRALWKIFVYPFYLSPFRHLPHPKGGYLLLGHGLSQFKRPPAEDYIRWMAEIPNDGVILFRGFLYADRLLLTSPQALADVLVNHSYDFVKPKPAREFLRLAVGDGIIMVEGDEHKFQRKHAQPTFNYRNLKKLYPTFWAKALELNRVIASELRLNSMSYSDEKPEAATGVIEIGHWAIKTAMDAIGAAGLGRQFNSLYNSEDELVKNYEELTEPTMEKALYFAANMIFGPRFVRMWPWHLNRLFYATTDSIKRISAQFVREKKEAIKSDPDAHVDLLALLIKSNDFSDNGLVDQLLTFIAAGHETTSSAFTWVMYLLSTRPELQSRLRTEIRSTFPSPSDASGLSADALANALESLPLTNAIIHETLRLYPTIPSTLRTAVRDTTILSQRIPAGTVIVISPWAINRSQHLWGPDAGYFRPERWIDAETGKFSPSGGAGSNYAMMTFLHGPRSCIGAGFAKAELRALIAAFIGAFEAQLVGRAEDVVAAGSLTIKPRDGLRVKVKPIDGWDR